MKDIINAGSVSEPKCECATPGCLCQVHDIPAAASSGPAATPKENPNVGELSGGGVWASFCDNDECSILGCPGDCRSERS